MISILKHIERLGREDKTRNAFRNMFESILNAIREHILVTDSEEHTWFCSSLESFQNRLREDSRATNVEVVSALVTKTLADHWAKLVRQTEAREEELKRIINLLTESAARLDNENKSFYLQLRTTVQSFQSLSQLDDVTFMRKKLSEQVTQLQESVARQEVVSQSVLVRMQAELDAARQEIETLTKAATTDALTQLPTRHAVEKRIRELVGKEEPFLVAMAVIEKLDLINLRYGAQTGDSVLRKFSGTLRSRLPERVLLSRWGGPAFVAVIEHIPSADVRASLQKILSDIAAEPVEVQGKASALFHIRSRYAVHQWTSGQPAEKIIGLVNVFCLAPKIDAEPEFASASAQESTR